MLRAGIAALLALAALSQGAPISDDNQGLEERQFQIGNPSATLIGGIPPPPTALPTSGPGTLPPITGGLAPPPKDRRQADTGPVLGGSDPSAVKAYITALELQYEALVQQFGANPPPPVLAQEKAIEKELAKYGIAIIATPDGTSTTITFGKRDTAAVDEGPFILFPGGGGAIQPDPTIPGGSLHPSD